MNHAAVQEVANLVRRICERFGWFVNTLSFSDDATANGLKGGSALHFCGVEYKNMLGTANGFAGTMHRLRSDNKRMQLTAWNVPLLIPYEVREFAFSWCWCSCQRFPHPTSHLSLYTRPILPPRRAGKHTREQAVVSRLHQRHVDVRCGSVLARLQRSRQAPSAQRPRSAHEACDCVREDRFRALHSRAARRARERSDVNGLDPAALHASRVAPRAEARAGAADRRPRCVHDEREAALRGLPLRP